jgi:hypothetical protein
MKALSRTGFILWANAFWLAQSGIEILAPQLRSYLAWRGLAFKPGLQIGCFRDTYYDSLTDRAYLVGLLWLLSAPLMTAIAWKLPECWPQRIGYFWWSVPRAGLSLAASLAALALAAWPAVARHPRARYQHHADGGRANPAHRGARVLLSGDPA